MKVTEVERKESTKHCCGNGCLQRGSAEHGEYAGALIDKRITESNVTKADRQANGLLEEIVSRENLNRAYKRVKRNKGAGGVDAKAYPHGILEEMETCPNKMEKFTETRYIKLRRRKTGKFKKRLLANSRMPNYGYSPLKPKA